MRSRYSLFLCFFIIPACNFAQIQITDQDVFALDQAVGIYENSTTFNIPVDLQTEGPNQMWDLSNLEMGDSTTFTQYEVMRIEGTSPEVHFPQANYAHVESMVDDTSWVLTSFIKLTQDSLHIAGCHEIFYGEESFKNHGDLYYYPLPLKYDTSWTSVKIDSFGVGDTTITTMYKTIDAYGKVKLPAGTFDCLRMRTISKDSSAWGVNWFIQYMFLSKENLLLAIVQGQPDDTTRNFSEALYVQRFYSISTAAIDDGSSQARMPEAFHLKQNYPNPFNPSTKLVFDVPGYSRVDLTVYNVNGERIQTLYSGYLYPGTYTSCWQGRDSANNPVPSGVYFCRLRSQGFKEVIRLILMR